MEISNEYKNKIFIAVLILLIVLSAYFTAKFFSEIRSYGVMGEKVENSISFSGHGEVFAVPDIANVSFNITKDAKTVKEAQDGVAQIEKKSLDFLKESGIADKDIKTANSSFYPKYEYIYDKELVPCSEYGCPPRPGKNVITGYTTSEGINVKIRNTDDVGKIMQGLGALGVSDLSGPGFAIDNEDELNAEARKLAIKDAKEKADRLAKDLGIRLGRIVSFNENGNYPAPMMYSKTTAMSEDSAGAPAVIPKGENKIASDVTITYEIK